ncbi:TPR-like protein [Rhizopus microsporus var. microsporus]|uniref:TPR-like protein n=2 Tax=Rhizopus microsporus TaxID=58291 RepID=A0A2G4SZ05_RHIZD|nr:TPR-like protein [Rhizopus microsporus ATCC 52813]ORE11726.1 TPR-like protein [Rhizopus microsporus var. microsporus]PHZ13977.1 TPR-like protein [Rhizopus microsporus ATCC 52813]
MASSSFSYGTRSKTIEVPLQHEQVLEVVCNDLPANPIELTDIFRQEFVGLPYYRMLATEYYEQDKIEQSIAVIQAALTMASQSAHTQPRQKLPLLTLIATLHLRLARKQSDENQRQKHIDEATQYVNEADRIHNQYEPTFIVKGNLYILLRKVDEAARSFNMILEKRPNCIPALLGRAKIQYHLQQYKAALKSYQDALRYSRGRFSGVEIRLGIAQCFAQLKMYPEAKAALKRCTEVSSVPNATALIMLSILELNESKKLENGPLQQEASLRLGLQHMQQAHRANISHPVTLNMMADHFFLTHNFEKTIAAASKAIDAASNNITKAESSYQIARTHHQMQNFEDAHKFYAQALELNPDHLLAQFGMGQMLLKRGERKPAIEIFEKILKAEPECAEVMKILGSLYGLVGDKEKSVALFDKLMEHTNEDPLLCMEIAEMHEEKDGALALKYYQQALKLLDDLPKDDEFAQKRVKEIRPQLLNNIAVMHHTLNNFADAEHYYGLAIQSTEASDEEEKNLKLTMSYNLARLYEEKLETEKATAIYTKLIEDYPTYVDAHLRMGAIEQSLGRSTEAIEYYKEVFDTEPMDAKAWIMIGQAQALTTEKLSKRSFEKVLRDCDKDDLYTHVALGNYHAATARELKSEKAKQQRIESYKLAVNFYSQALRRDPTNVYAANGLAITIAENGHIEQARDLFNQVRESNVGNSSVWVNLAHIFVELKQYRQAIVMYENCSRKFFNNKDINLLLCLARAQYILAKAEKDHEAMHESLKNTVKALSLCPSDKTTLYNLALVQQSYAQQIADLTQEQRDSKSMRRALEYLDFGQRTFRQLISVDEHTLYDKKIVEQRERYGETLRTQLERKLAEQVQFEEQKREKLELAKKRREEDIAKQRAIEDEKRRLEQIEREKMEEARRKLMEKVREDNLMMASLQVDEDDIDEEKKSSKRGKKRKERDEEQPEEEDEKDALLRKKDKKNYRTKRIIEDSEDEDE